MQRTPYRGQVMASDQGSGAFVLFAASTGIFLGERSFGNGTYLTPPRQLSTTTPGAVPPQGTVLAGGSNTWWAVWSEQVGPGGEFAQTDLFQAKTYGNDLTRARQRSPRPGGQARHRSHLTRPQPAAHLRHLKIGG